jgi:hypothetical protein
MRPVEEGVRIVKFPPIPLYDLAVSQGHAFLLERPSGGLPERRYHFSSARGLGSATRAGRQGGRDHDANPPRPGLSPHGELFPGDQDQPD